MLPGIYPVMVALGAVITLVTQAAILSAEDVSVGRSLLVSLVAAASGLVGAKLLYAALHPQESILKGGWAVDGFFIVAPVSAIIALLALDLPIGVYLDAITPGLFLAVAIGRIGCFLTGCCAGHISASRWAVWSSDRRVGARRVPAQLLESAIGLVIGATALALILLTDPPVHGAVFLAAFAAYALLRQWLLRLRAERRTSARSLPLTAAAAVIVILTVAATLLVFPHHPSRMFAIEHGRRAQVTQVTPIELSFVSQASWAYYPDVGT